MVECQDGTLGVLMRLEREKAVKLPREFTGQFGGTPVCTSQEQEWRPMSQARRTSAAAALALATVITLLLVAPAAAASGVDDVSPAVTPAGPHPDPIALATTGLNITVPVIIGISTLILGIAFLAWAFLRTGRTQQHR
jgi:hypothetical protein